MEAAVSQLVRNEMLDLRVRRTRTSLVLVDTMVALAATSISLLMRKSETRAESGSMSLRFTLLYPLVMSGTVLALAGFLVGAVVHYWTWREGVALVVAACDNETLVAGRGL